MGQYLAPALIGSRPYLAPATAPASSVGTTPVRFDFPMTYAILGTVLQTESDIVSVSVLPATVTLQGGAPLQFVANVQTKNGADPTVGWTAPGGAITSGGVFLAPAATSQDQVITVRATSVQDPNKWGEAQVRIIAQVTRVIEAVSVRPSVASVLGGESIQFDAEVVGMDSPSQEVTWKTNLGVVSARGVVVAPDAGVREQVGIVTATSVEDPSKSGTAVLVVAPGMATAFTPSVSRQVRILPGRLAFAVGSHWTLGSAGPVGSKDPNSAIDVPFDWSDWLADIGDPALAKIEFLLGGGLTSDGVVPNARGGTVVVSGGSLRETGTITCRITTDTTPPRIEDRTVVLQMKEQ